MGCVLGKKNNSVNKTSWIWEKAIEPEENWPHHARAPPGWCLIASWMTAASSPDPLHRPSRARDQSEQGTAQMFWSSHSSASIHAPIPPAFSVVTLAKGVHCTDTTQAFINFTCLLIFHPAPLKVHVVIIFPSKFYPSAWIIPPSALSWGRSGPWLPFSSP